MWYRDSPGLLSPIGERMPGRCLYANCKRKQRLLQEYIDTPQQLLEFTDAELRSFHTAINCHMCNQPLGGDKVRDHCHIVGNYRGAEHSRCNLAYRISKSEWKLQESCITSRAMMVTRLSKR